FGEQLLFVVAEDLFGCQLVSCCAELADTCRHHHNILFLRVNVIEHPLKVTQRVVVAHRYQQVARPYTQCTALDCVLLEQLELFFHFLLDGRVASTVGPLRDGKNKEKSSRKREPSDGGNRFGEQVHQGHRKEHHKHRCQANRNLVTRDTKIGGHLPSALAFVFETEHQHCQAVEGETPDHTKGIGLAQPVHISAACQNREDLQEYYEVDDAVSCSKTCMRTAEPFAQNTIFRNPVEHSVRANNCSVDRSRQDEKSHHHYKGSKHQLQYRRPPHRHSEAGDQIVFVDGNADCVRYQHHRKQC